MAKDNEQTASRQIQPHASLVEVKPVIPASDKSGVSSRTTNPTESLVQWLLDSGPDCLRVLADMAADYDQCRGPDSRGERAFIVEEARLCLLRAHTKAQPSS
jgi:hypothetical protein